MGTYRQILYQIVFHTKYNRPTLQDSSCEELYKYISGIINNNKCKLYQINGIEDHIHIVCDLHPSVALADLVKDIKIASSIWLKQSGKFPTFEGWTDGYGAFTYSIKAKQNLIQYVKNQKEHHQKQIFKDEYKSLLVEHDIEFEEKYIL